MKLFTIGFTQKTAGALDSAEFRCENAVSSTTLWWQNTSLGVSARLP